MEQAYRDYNARGLEILAVSIDAGSEAAVAAKVNEFMAELKLTFPAVLDLTGDVVQAYRLRGLPTTFLIDRKGVIRVAEIGFRDWARLRIPQKARGAVEVAMWCHLLLVVPFIVAGLFLFLPWTTALPIAGLLGGGTALVVYYGWRAMRQPVVTGRDALMGGQGEAVSDLDPEGLVRLRGELWLAEARPRVSKGQPVEVVEVTGAKLRVRPWS